MHKIHKVYKRTANMVLEAIEDRIKSNTFTNGAILPSVNFNNSAVFFNQVMKSGSAVKSTFSAINYSF